MHKQFFSIFQIFLRFRIIFCILIRFFYSSKSNIFHKRMHAQNYIILQILQKRNISFTTFYKFFINHIFARLDQSLNERVSTRKGKWEKRNNVQSFRKKQCYSSIFVINRYTVIKRFVTIVRCISRYKTFRN